MNRFRTARVEWARLDNASKIFPATSNNKDTKVFRLTCELFETVKPEILQQALNETVENFPLHRSILRRGVFWYYLETSDIQPIVEIESNPVCSPIYKGDKRNLLFRIFYYNNRINLELFHALSDGIGALWFMQSLVYHYIIRRYKDNFVNTIPTFDCNSSISKKIDDSFEKHFIGNNKRKQKSKDRKKENTSAYHIKGTRLEENRIKLIEGSMSVKAVLDQAHGYNTTLTIFLTSLFIYSIYKVMPVHMKNHPVVLSVPINLRYFFESVTARNFFSTMNVGYDFGKSNDDFKEVIHGVNQCFQNDLTEERLNYQLKHLMALEQNPFIRAIPLPLKDCSLRIATKLTDRKITSTISNIGQVSMPLGFDSYIRQFSICISARRPQITMCSYEDRLVVSFTSPFRETEIQRTFFQLLSKMGIEIEISSNI
ncbi:MAG: hypothetical protein PHE41_05980 [Eubacteriales bacterium]|nr:hypothetical protein [Eubacteriales bacterium]